jgi:monoterpene epsilon-lactone hydrolase
LGSALSEGYAAGELAHRAKARVVSVNYRLLPEATLEQAIEDVVTVYRYLLDEMHVKATNVIPFGCSAGGMLTLMTLQMIKTHHKELPLPIAAATLAPGPGLEYAIDIPFLEWKSARIPPEENIILPRELGVLVQKYVYHSHNLETDTFHENKNSHTAKELLRDFTGLPPLYVSSGELDVLRDGVIKFAELLKKENVPVDFSIQKRMIHCAASMSQFIDEGHNELDVIAQWMNDKFKN